MTDTSIKKAKLGDKPMKLSDGKGFQVVAVEVPIPGQREGHVAGGLSRRIPRSGP